MGVRQWKQSYTARDALSLEWCLGKGKEACFLSLSMTSTVLFVSVFYWSTWKASLTKKARRLDWRYMLYCLIEEEWRGRIEKNGSIFFEFLKSEPSKKLETCKDYQIIRMCGGQWGDLNASHQSSNNVKIWYRDACGVAGKEMKMNKSLHIFAPKSLNVHFHHTPYSKNNEWFTFRSTPSLPPSLILGTFLLIPLWPSLS